MNSYVMLSLLVATFVTMVTVHTEAARSGSPCSKVTCPRGKYCIVDPSCVGSNCRTYCIRGRMQMQKPKPGKCPRFNIWNIDFSAKCESTCMYDQDCPDNKKCCLSGCGKKCQPPYAPPKNFALDICPPTWMIREKIYCGEACYDDKQCGFGRKCCSNGCGHQCMEMFTFM